MRIAVIGVDGVGGCFGAQRARTGFGVMVVAPRAACGFADTGLSPDADGPPNGASEGDR